MWPFSDGGPLCLLVLWLCLSFVQSSTPNVIISADGWDETWLAKRALFGNDVESVEGTLTQTPDSDRLLCEYFKSDGNGTYIPDPSISATEGNPIIMFTPRGGCTFEKKAWVAQEIYGAAGILVYDNLEGRYGWNETTERVIFPEAVHEYECENGFGTVGNLTLDPPRYNGTLLNPELDMTLSDTCSLFIQTKGRRCESGLCMVTSHKEGSDEYPVCCAWDTLRTMDVDRKFKTKPHKIMPVMITVRQSEIFMDVVGTTITMKDRPYSAWNPSMFFLWILATAITGYACWYSAQSYRYYRAKLRKIQDKRKNKQGGADPESGADLDINLYGAEDLDVAEEEHDLGDEDFGDEEDEDDSNKSQQNTTNGSTLHSLPPKKMDYKTEEEVSKVFAIYFNENRQQGENHEYHSLFSLPPPRKKKKKKPRRNEEEDDLNFEDELENQGGDDEDDDDDEPTDVANSGIGTMEMSMYHVLMFVVTASIMLLLLFFLEFYNLISVLYAIGCAGAVSFLLFAPLIGRIVPKFGDEVVEELNKRVICNLNGFDVLSQGAGYIWAAVWIWYGLSHYRPSQNWFFWITLNTFGACFCILMLSMFKLNSLKIAALLGVAVFFYDIFFVFITPFLTGGESIMLTVARGGAEASEVADDLCYKYPKHKDCTGIDFLPMLLALPRIRDFRGGSSLLGLGDIVLPGFLIGFAARVDEAKRLLAYQTSIEVQDVPHKWYQGYFFPLMVAYAIGLILANVAVVLMQRGQPALLYLVPCCLGTMRVVGRKEWKDMWLNCKVLRTADKLIRRCDKHWGQQRMKRLVERRKREKALEEERGRGRGRGYHGRGQNASRGRGPTNRVEPPRGQSGRRAQPGGRQAGRGPGRGKSGRGQPGRGRGRGGRGQQGERDASPRKGGRRASAPGAQPTSSAPAGTQSLAKKNVRGKENGENRQGTPNDLQSPSLAKEKQKGTAITNKKPKATNESPKDGDVCFGRNSHPGTEEFNEIVRETASSMGDKEYGTPVYKAIRKRLQGKRLFKEAGTGQWVQANKDDAIELIGEAFNLEKKRMGKS